MDNVLSQTPENKQPDLAEDIKPVEQNDKLSIKTDEKSPDVRQEQISVSQPASPSNQQQTNQTVLQGQNLISDQPIEVSQSNTQLTEEDDNKISTKDLPWVKKAETIISKDKDKPYQEEEDSEKLQQEYLEKNYGVKVEIDNNQPPR